MGKELVYRYRNPVNDIKYNGNGIGGRLNFSGDVGYITFPVLERIPYVKHGFSTRLGGVSKDHLSSLNLSFTMESNPENVIENYSRICSALAINPISMIFSDQVHDTKIHVVREEDRRSVISYEKELVGIDGLITNVKGLTLVTYYADCVPLYFVDTRNHAIGLSHSGWKGTVHKMAVRTIEAMTKEYGTNPKDVVAVIGPSICQECYEISEDVALEFQNAYDSDIVEQILERKENGKYQLDLWLANTENCREAGILKENITVSNICTCCNHDILYSHRASKGKRGNLAAFLSLCE
ncbi:MAG TPA: peptidoglycan editing factor PgeF [Lachnospiraceae bacterium]|nr:peptidoglycan editing factor PgeF [Lachnospiraceae bacterium]